MAFEATATRPPVVTTEALAVGHVETLPVDVRPTSVDVARTAQGSAVARGQRWGMAPRCPSPMPLPPDFLEGPPDFEGRFAPQISGRLSDACGTPGGMSPVHLMPASTTNEARSPAGSSNAVVPGSAAVVLAAHAVADRALPPAAPSEQGMFPHRGLVPLGPVWEPPVRGENFHSDPLNWGPTAADFRGRGRHRRPCLHPRWGPSEGDPRDEMWRGTARLVVNDIIAILHDYRKRQYMLMIECEKEVWQKWMSYFGV